MHFERNYYNNYNLKNPQTSVMTPIKWSFKSGISQAMISTIQLIRCVNSEDFKLAFLPVFVRFSAKHALMKEYYKFRSIYTVV